MTSGDQHREEAKRTLDVLDAAEPVRAPDEDVVDDEAGIDRTERADGHTRQGGRS